MEEIKETVKIDFSNNGINDINSMRDLNRIVHLNLANNRIKNVTVFAQEECFTTLRWLDISGNKFSEVPAFKCPKLEYLNISGNKIEKVNEGFTGHETIRTLVSVDNRFKSLAPFKIMPKLEELYLAQNNISSLSGWEQLP